MTMQQRQRIHRPRIALARHHSQAPAGIVKIAFEAGAERLGLLIQPQCLGGFNLCRITHRQLRKPLPDRRIALFLVHELLPFRPRGTDDIGNRFQLKYECPLSIARRGIRRDREHQ